MLVYFCSDSFLIGSFPSHRVVAQDTFLWLRRKMRLIARTSRVVVPARALALSARVILFFSFRQVESWNWIDLYILLSHDGLGHQDRVRIVQSVVLNTGLEQSLHIVLVLNNARRFAFLRVSISLSATVFLLLRFVGNSSDHDQR